MHSTTTTTSAVTLMVGQQKGYVAFKTIVSNYHHRSSFEDLAHAGLAVEKMASETETKSSGV